MNQQHPLAQILQETLEESFHLQEEERVHQETRQESLLKPVFHNKGAPPVDLLNR